MTSTAIEESFRVLSEVEDNIPAIKSQDEVASAISTLADYWESKLREKYMEGVDGAPDWLEYEHRLWQLGESLRAVLRNKKWRGENVILNVSAIILCAKRFGKGRQSFALLLGEFGRGNYAQELGSMLDDEEVNGHCIKALTKGKVGGFEAEVLNVYENSNGWIRSSAKKYLDKFK